MSISMYQASAPRFANTLRNLDAILRKGEAHAVAHKFDPAVLLQARLYPDMFPLLRQVQIACDNAKGPVARLAGMEPPRHEDIETTFGELYSRIGRTLEFIASVPAAAIDGAEERRITIKAGQSVFEFVGLQYLCGYAIPNFHFHVVTAYNILRHNGVDIGKRDYIGQP